MGIKLIRIEGNKAIVEIDGEETEYKYIPTEDIYKKNNELHQKFKETGKIEKLDFSDHCIIDFSIHAYKELFGLPLSSHVNLYINEFKKSCFILKNYKMHDFVDTQFGEGKVDFSYAHFGEGRVAFNRAIFGEGDVDFSLATFREGYVDFNGAIFGEGKVDFSFVNFSECDVDFSSANFGEGKVDFRGANFGEGKVNFARANFGEDKVDFSGARVTKIIFKYNSFVNLICKFNECEYLIFEEIFINGSIRYPNKPIIKSLDSKNIYNHGKMYLSWDETQIHKAIYNSDASLKDKKETFLLFKENFRNIGRYDDEDKAYVEFKKTELRANFIESIKGRWWKKFKLLYKIPEFLFKWFVFEQIGKYGTAPGRIILSMLVTVISFGFIYSSSLISISEKKFSGSAIIEFLCKFGLDSELLNNFFSGLYYSFITFLTIGYGDIAPTNLACALLSGLEGFLGLFLMAYFTIAFARKVLR